MPKSGSESIDDYLKAVLELSGPGDQPATSNAIAQHLGVSAPSVTGMLQKLSGETRPSITYQKHHGARLTMEGRRRALRIVRRHRLIELFLCEVLGYSWDEVHDEAERLEHVISDRLEDRIAEKLGNPQFDPHGDIIPGKDGTLPDRRTMRLIEVPPRARVIVCSVSDRDPEILRYLQQIGLVPQSEWIVLEHQPFDGPTMIQVSGKEEVRGISPKLARAVLVEKTS